MQFIVYDIDGNIIGHRDQPSEDVEIIEKYRTEGELLLAADQLYPPETHYITSGAVVQKPHQPTPFHTWSVQLKEWVKNPSAEWEAVRDKRDLLLAGTDWMVLPDSPVTPGRREAIQIYRQALRDITAQSDPLNIIWPTRPEVL